jgi:methionine-rich copper-binding protein CopC
MYQETSQLKIPLSVVVLITLFMPLISGIIPVPIYCHPSPVIYEPQPNQIISSIETIPNAVTITFTEKPEIKASNIRVMDSNNERVDNQDLKLANSDKSLSVSLDKLKLKVGTYTINWLILSKDDGFMTKGTYTFSIS